MTAETIRPSQHVVEQIVARLGELHDPDADLIALVIACAESGRWVEMKPHLYEILTLRGQLAGALAVAADVLLAGRSLH